jgi:hypothetical protein
MLTSRDGGEHMKKLGALVAFAVVAFTVATAHAQNYGMAGCGLGSLLFEKDNSKGMQILAAILNGTGGQTFAITSGTSNCVEAGVVKAEREQAAFAEVNFQDLKRNMAAGGGEFLASFSTLLGCEDTAKPAFFKMTQRRFESIVPSAETTPMGMVASIKREIRSDAALAGACSDARAVARAQGKTAPTAAATRPTTAAPRSTNVALAKP